MKETSTLFPEKSGEGPSKKEFLLLGREGLARLELAKALAASRKRIVRMSSELPLTNKENPPRIDFVIFLVSTRSVETLNLVQRCRPHVEESSFHGRCALALVDDDPADARRMKKKKKTPRKRRDHLEPGDVEARDPKRSRRAQEAADGAEEAARAEADVAALAAAWAKQHGMPVVRGSVCAAVGGAAAVAFGAAPGEEGGAVGGAAATTSVAELAQRTALGRSAPLGSSVRALAAALARAAARPPAEALLFAALR